MTDTGTAQQKHFRPEKPKSHILCHHNYKFTNLKLNSYCFHDAVCSLMFPNRLNSQKWILFIILLTSEGKLLDFITQLQ